MKSQKLKNSKQIHKLAGDLGYKLSANPISDILCHCDKKITEIMQIFPECQSLTEMLDYVANRVGTKFEIVTDDDSLFKLQQKYIRQKEFGFSRLDEFLEAETDLGVTFRLTKQAEWELPFVSVIDCRGAKIHRAYFTKWHEIAHILTLPPKSANFSISHDSASSNQPLEKLMDIIAGKLGFYSPITSKFTTNEISFEAVELLRQQLCPTASFQSALINFSKFWSSPCILIEANLALKKDEQAKSNQLGFYFHEPAEPKLRAIHVTLSDTAREDNFVIHQNMRVPEKSVITEIFYGKSDYLQSVEDLSWWESKGKSLLSSAVKVSAKRFGSSINVLITSVK